MPTKKRTLEVTTDHDEADAIVCILKDGSVEADLVKPVGFASCMRCGQAVVFHDVYPSNKPKICTDCITLELESGIN